MKTKLAMCAAAIFLSPVILQAQTQTKLAGGFDRFKTLVGEWQATDESGKPFISTFRLVSNDTALEETFQSDKNDQMVTLYAPDGGRLALTHYCSMGNQPPPTKCTISNESLACTGVPVHSVRGRISRLRSIATRAPFMPR